MSSDKLKGPLAVTVHKAEGIHDVQFIGKMDPYVKIHIGSEEFKTKIAHDGGRNPNWEQAFMFNLDGKEDFLHIMIKDHRVLSDDVIGRCDVPLTNLVSTTDAQWFQVTDRTNFEKLTGKISLSATFTGAGGPASKEKELADQKKAYDAEVAKLAAANEQLKLQTAQQELAMQQQEIKDQQQLLNLETQKAQQQQQQPQVVVVEQQQPQQQQDSSSSFGSDLANALAQDLQQQVQQSEQQDISNEERERKRQHHHGNKLPERVTFKSYHGKFVCAETDFSVVANRDKAAQWETWRAEHVGGNKYNFKSHHGRFLCAEANQTIIANREKAQGWETFELEHKGGSNYNLKTAHGRFVCVEPSGAVVGNREKAAQWETFSIE